MQFDHRDPLTKKFLVCQTWLSSEARILREAAKCDIVCPNCHRDRTFRRRQATAGVAQSEEHEFSKLRVAGSSPVSRSDQEFPISESIGTYAAFPSSEGYLDAG